MAKQNTLEINTKEGQLNKIEFISNFQKNYKTVIPVIDGKKCPMLAFMYDNEEDYNEASKFITDGLKATGGDIAQTMGYFRAAMLATANGINVDAEIVVENISFIVDYSKKTAYTAYLTPFCTLDDINCRLSKEAVVSLLKERIEKKIAEQKRIMAERKAEQEAAEKAIAEQELLKEKAATKKKKGKKLFAKKSKNKSGASSVCVIEVDNGFAQSDDYDAYDDDLCDEDDYA